MQPSDHRCAAETRRLGAWHTAQALGVHIHQTRFAVRQADLSCFPVFIATDFTSRLLEAPLVFFFATAVAISPIVIGLLSDASRESLEVDFFAMILSR
jgi:hypothetical protein